MSEESVKIINAELTLASIRQDTITAAAELSNKYAEKKLVEEGIEIAKKHFNQEILDFKKERDLFEDDKKRLVYATQDSEKAIQGHKDQLKVIDSQRAEAMKDLRRLNDWILSAETQEKSLKESLVSLGKSEADKKKYTADLETAKKESADAEEYLGKVKAETRLILDSTRTELAKLQADAHASEVSLAETKKQRALEDIALHEVIDYRIRVQKDIEIYITRVEEKYNEAFPELRMKFT